MKPEERARQKIGHALIGVEEQSAKYLTHLPPTLETHRSKLPFSYESNSVETRFTNHYPVVTGPFASISSVSSSAVKKVNSVAVPQRCPYSSG